MSKDQEAIVKSLLGHVPEDFFEQFKTMAELNRFIDGLFKRGVEVMLRAEMTDHLGYNKHSIDGKNSGNSRNGNSRKILKTPGGEVQIEIPRDRNGSFEPVIVPKHQRVIDKIESVVISLYARGMSTRDIEQQIKDIYGVSLSATSISNITEQVLVDVDQWQKRPLDSLYPVIWMDGISIKTRDNGKIINKSVYLIVGLNTSGSREVLSMWINETESASFWMHVLNDLKTRGVNDVLIACSDNLKGLNQAIKAIFPDAVAQLCVVHQLRNTMRFVNAHDKQPFLKDSKKIYDAADMETAQKALLDLEDKWMKKYPYAVKSWAANWEGLTGFIQYPIELRKIIYTTNIIENLNRHIRKYTKTKSMFPNDDAVRKAVYLAVQHASFKWTTQIPKWPMIANQLSILYPDRFKPNNNVLY
jgi:transposase-like protein